MADQITVEIIYALPEVQDLLVVDVEEGIKVRQVILDSGILERYPELDIDAIKVGIFGKLTTMKQTLRNKDRIEIYRPLIADPKDVRKRRAAEGKALKKGGGKLVKDQQDKEAKK